MSLVILLKIFMSVLGLHCCTQAFSSCGTRGLLSSCCAQVSHCRGFSCFRAQVSVVVVQRLGSMMSLPGPGIEPWPPGLAGRTFTTVPPGKPNTLLLIILTMLYITSHDFESISRKNNTRKIYNCFSQWEIDWINYGVSS